MVVTPFIFWSLVAFGGLGFISFFLAFFFPNRDLASDMYEELEDFFEGLVSLVISCVIYLSMIISFPFVFLTAKLFPKDLKEDAILVLKERSYIKKVFSKVIVKNLTNDEIIQFQNRIDGHVLFKKIGNTNFDLMDKIINNTDYWEHVSRNCSFEILSKFPTRVIWRIVLETTKLTEEQIVSLKDYIDWNLVAYNQSFSEDFFFEYSNRIQIRYINVDKNPWMREENQSSRVSLFINSQ
jgi:hypothetical protein